MIIEGILRGIGTGVIIYGVLMVLIHILGFIGGLVEKIIEKLNPTYNKIGEVIAKWPLSTTNKKRVAIISFTILALIIAELTL